MPEQFVKDHLREKLRDVGIQTCTIFIDNILLAVWLVVEYLIEHYVVPKFPVTSQVTKISLWFFRSIFAISTVVPSLAFTYRDVRIIWLRSKFAVARAKLEADPKTLELVADDNDPVKALSTGAGELQ